MSVGDIFKSIGRFFQKILPFLGDALDNPVIRAILISKLGQKAVDIIIAIVAIIDKEELTNETKHNVASSRIRADFTKAGIPQPSNSEMDIHVKMAVKKLRGEGDLQVPKGL